MERRKSLGLSLIELTMFIVIVGAAVAGIIGVIAVTTRSSADPMVHKQALAIAEAVLEEVELQPFTYCDPDDPGAATADLAGAPIAFRAAGTPVAISSATSITLNAPTGVLSTDIVLAGFMFTKGTDAVFTPPAGWTLAGRTDSGTNRGLAVYWALGSVASYAFPVAGVPNIIGFTLAYSGVDNTSPIDITGGQANASATLITAPSVTTTVANAMLVGFFGIRSDSTFSAAFGTLRQSGASAPVSLAAADAVQAAAGASGTKTVTASVAAANVGQLLALKPGAGCPVLAEAIGPEAGETRYSTTLPFDNVNDYHGFDSNVAQSGLTGIRNIDSTLITGLDGYRVTVSVAGQPLGAIGNDTYGRPQSLLITVTVTGPGNTTVTLNGYRTRYAPNDLP